MGLLDWLLRPFRKGAPQRSTDATDEADFFGDAPSSASGSKAAVTADRAPARSTAPKEAKPAPKEAKPAPPKPKPAAKAVKPVKAAKAPKPPKAERPKKVPEPAAPPQPSSELLSAEEAERRYGAMFAAPVEPPAPKKVRRAPPPVQPPPPAVESAVELAAADLPGEAPPPVVLGPSVEDEARERAEARRAEAAEHRRQANLPRYQALLSRADALLAVPEVDPRHLLTAKRQLMEDWRALGAPPADSREALRAALDQRLDAFTARGKSAFDAMDEERRENLERRRAIVTELEELAVSADLGDAGKTLARLAAAWREIGPAPREEADALRAAYDAARDRVHDRRRAERERAETTLNEQLSQLERLATQAETLQNAADPQAAAERVKALQAQWKNIRPHGGRERQQELWTRFRAACDAVFARRNESRREELAANLARRQAILARAEALAEGEPPEDPEAVIRRLMNDWRKVGFVPREDGDRLWAAFKGACDRLREPPRVELPTEDAGALHHQPFAALAKGEP